MSREPSFEDLAGLTDREIQTLLREVDQKDCVVALKGASDAVKARFLGNMSERVGTFIKEEMEYLGPRAQEDIDTAQQRILQQVAQLGRQGQVTWPPPEPPARVAKPKLPKLSKEYLAQKRAAKAALQRPLGQLTFAEIDALMASLTEIARREGILALEGLLPPPSQGEPSAIAEKEFLTAALRLAVDGTEPKLIREVMEHWMESLLRAQERKYRKATEGVLSVQQGDNPRITEYKLAVIY